MRLLVSLAVWCAALAPAAELPYFAVLGDDAAAWPAILSSIGLEPAPADAAHVLVVRSGASASRDWATRVEGGAILILEGESSLAGMFGFRPGAEHVRVASLLDAHRPHLPVIWEKPLELPVFVVPEEARVFARERWTGAPLIAGFRRGQGAVLWIAVSPGERGYERFPYLLAALCGLGLEPPFRSTGLWAFFDFAYRSRVDLEYFAARWRNAGIGALHVAGWHFYEPDAERDAYLTRLIELCHREGILVYAWLELPHVSDKFWSDHPEWREKTAILQDAHLDWRKLMNLANRQCFRAASAGIRNLLSRFDWDGVNLAELYFESLEGLDNPSRLTPMNDDVRAAFRARYGFDPVSIFSAHADSASRKLFLEFRRDLARRIQEEWLDVLESAREQTPHLDIVLTHVDDRFDPAIRDALGADAGRMLELLDRRAFTFLIEDPATVWDRGPDRYHQLWEAYRNLTSHPENLAIDLNVVERYQDVYPTKQPTGIELFQLVHQASGHFPRIAVYFESSLLAPDLTLLQSSAARVNRIVRAGSGITADASGAFGIPWEGAVKLDEQLWPATDGHIVWIPAGVHRLEAAPEFTSPRLLRLSGNLLGARVLSETSIEFSYRSQPRAIAIFDRMPRRIRIDGRLRPASAAGPTALFLPPGRHLVTASTE